MAKARSPSTTTVSPTPPVRTRGPGRPKTWSVCIKKRVSGFQEVVRLAQRRKIRNGVLTTAVMLACGIFTTTVIVPGCQSRAARQDAENRAHEQWVKSMGYVVVQYTADKHVARCWVTSGVPDCCGHISGPRMPIAASDLAWIEVPDRNDAAGFARKLGVADVSQCIEE